MDWGYVTGYFDGEGTVCLAKSNMSLVWHNTHRESLEAMRSFMGCGIVKSRKPGAMATKQPWLLVVSDVVNIAAVARAMLPHAMIKRDGLLLIIERADRTTPMSANFGAIARAGAKEISRLYWTEGLTQEQIAKRYGVSSRSVKDFMKRNAIPARSKSVVMTGRRHSEETKRRMAEARRLKWQDPEYRARMSDVLRRAGIQPGDKTEARRRKGAGGAITQ